MLRARALTKHFRVRGRGARAVHAVDGLDLAIGRGEVVALVGESGSGKSTVARLLAKLLPSSSGQVELDGRPVQVRSGRSFRRYCRDVQMILQDPFASLNAVHTVRYVLTRAVRIHHPDLGPAERQARIEQLLGQVDLAPPERYLPKYPHELSGGQRQRVAIARALAASPKVLLADEPISMLDVSIRVGILNLLQDLRQRFRVGVLYITHDIASARYFADRTVVMYAGQAVERGSSESVTQRPSHPYTQLLIASAPDPDAPVAGPAAVRSGEPPSLVDPGPGCRFRARCPHAMPVCERQDPPFLPAADDGHEARCWLLDPAVQRAEPQVAGGTEAAR